MQFSDFPEANRARTAPEGMEATVGTLPAYDDGRVSISCWVPTDEERAAIAAGGCVWLGCLSVQPPVWVSGHKPAMPPVEYQPSEKELRAIEFIAGLLPDPATVAAGLREGSALAAEQPELRRPDGRGLVEGQLYYLGGPAVAAEHYAAMLEAYRTGGHWALVAYLQPYEAFLPTEVLPQPS